MKAGLRYIIAHIFIFSTALCYGQDNIDSLIHLSNTVSSDTERVDLFNAICAGIDANDLKKANEYAYKALDLSQSLGYKKGIIESYKSIGRVLYAKGEYQSAIENYIKALKLSEATGDKQNTGKLFHNIGMVYNALGIYDKALENEFKAIEIYNQFNNKKGASKCYSAIGVIYLNTNKYDKALIYFNKALLLCNEIKYYDGAGVQYVDIGLTYLGMNKYQDAIDNLSKAVDIFQNVKYFYGIAGAKIAMGQVYIKMNNFKKAESIFLSALEVSQQTGVQENIRDCYRGLSDVYSNIGNFNKAFRYQSLYMEKKDSISNRDISIKINQMENNYEQEKKDKAVALKNQERELKQQAEIDSQTTTKRYLMVGVILLLILAGVIFDKYRVKNKSNIKLEEKNKEIAKKNKEITDSINYAKRIQDAILPPVSLMEKLLPNSFVFYKPKDIVSGDFYWTEKIKNKTLFAVADCTNHGVSGAMMSVLCSNLLTDARNKGIDSPSEILDHANRQICRNLHQTSGEETVNDGMDIAICALDNETLELEFAGAKASIFIIRKGEIIEMKGDKMPINEHRTLLYNNYRTFLQKGDNLFLFTDGINDQFGQDNNKRFMKKNLKALLLAIQGYSMEQQKEKISDVINKWQGNLEQTDDITIMGIKI